MKPKTKSHMNLLDSFLKGTYFAGLLLLCLAMNSCEDYQSKLDEEQHRQRLLEEQLNTLVEEEKLIKGEYGDAMETLAAIDEALSEMAANNKEMDRLIQQKELAKGTTNEQVIMAKLQSLKDANIEADKAARRLRSKVKAFKVENAELKKLVANLDSKFVTISAQVDSVNTTLATMRASLTKLEADVAATETDLSMAYANLKMKTNQLIRTNLQLENELETLKSRNEFITEDGKAYIACGTKKVLRRNNILRMLSAKTLTLEYQEEVKGIGSELDYYNSDQIDCGDGVIQFVLPVRDPNSYEINGATVTVKDKKTFWATSKCIVLVKK